MKQLLAKIITILSTIIIFLLLTSCEMFTEPEQADLSPDSPDAVGNLIIANHSGERLALYNGETLIKILPNSSSEYLVNIPNPDNLRIELRLYKLADIEDDFDNPDPDLVFKSWDENYPSDTDPEHRLYWYVSANDLEINSGSVTYYYYGSGEVNVDVFLNSLTGAKLATLRPGQTNRTIGVDYALYTVHYQYWTSDPGTADGSQNLGVINTEIKNGQEVAIAMNLNYESSPLYITVPTWDNSDPGMETGQIRIKNYTAETLQIWTGNTLIENIMISENPTQNMSTISAGNSVTYTIPVGGYELAAKKLDGELVESITITIYKDNTTYWDVGGSDNPVLDINVSGLTFSPTDNTQYFTISNSGTGNLDWNIQTSADFLTCSPASSINQSTVSTNINRSGLAIGQYYETLSVFSNGGTQTINIQVDNSVIVQNDLPIAVILVAESNSEPMYYYFNASTSTDDHTATNSLEYRWSFEAGGAFTDWSNNNMYIEHQYSTPGTYVITLHVRDEEGAIGAASMELEVADNVSVSEQEPNDSYYTANLIYVFDLIAGEIGYGNDAADWFVFNQPNNGQVQLEIENLHNQNVSNGKIGPVRLYDSNLNELTRFGSGFGDVTSPGSSAMSEIVVISANTDYYIKVSQHSDHAAPYSLICYFQ